MTRTPLRLALLLAVAALAVLGPAAAVPAQGEGVVEVSETTGATFAPGTEPAVVVSGGEAAEDEPAWTFRYLVPTLLVLTGLALAAVVLGYGVRVKGRYRVVR